MNTGARQISILGLSLARVSKVGCALISTAARASTVSCALVSIVAWDLVSMVARVSMLGCDRCRCHSRLS